MAAAEYFSNASMTQPTSHPQQVPQIQTHPAPSNQGVHFAPTPVELKQRHSFSGQQRPNFQQQNGWYQSPNMNPYQQQNYAMQHHSPQHHTPPHSMGSTPPQQRPQHLAPHMRPYANPNSSQYSLQGGYSSDPEPDRRKHKHKKRRDSDEKKASKSRSTRTDAFLGAAGGGLIGDLIFPGLGTVGGAALGYIGGKDYGKHRKVREDDLAVAQREWEEKHRPELHRRERSRDHSSRDSSHHGRSRERRRSDEKR